MKLITAIVRPDAVDDVQVALAQLGVSGMTVTEVSGFARQMGHVETYRGEDFTINFIAKVKVEILADDTQTEEIVNTIVVSARSGTVGDGKVWVQDVSSVVRIRTGERDTAAV